MLAGRRYLLAFTDQQASYAEQVSAVCRAVWNTALEQRREYRRRGAFISYVEQARQLAEAKKDPDCGWLADAPSHTLQQTLRDLDKACRTHETWKVRWRSKTRTAPSFRFPDPNHLAVRRLNRRWGEVKLPKFGAVRFRWTRPLGGTIRNATISRDADRWFISFCGEDDVAEVAPNGKPPIGVDRGVATAVATSDGDLHDRQFVTSGEAARLRGRANREARSWRGPGPRGQGGRPEGVAAPRRRWSNAAIVGLGPARPGSLFARPLKRLQQRLSRSLHVHGCNRRSKRRDAVRVQLGRLNARIRARRGDFAAQTAVRLVRNHGTVVVEDLRVRNMTASAKGTTERPGRNVRQKASLNRAILTKGWGRFLLALEHSARYHGTTVVKVNPAYTSQTCHACRHVAPDSRESQAVFRCVACGHRAHADVNAAKNILAAGLAVTERGDLAIERSTKR